MCDYRATHDSKSLQLKMCWEYLLNNQLLLGLAVSDLINQLQLDCFKDKLK